MAGHGSTPPPDRSNDPSRSVTRDSGMLREESEGGLIREYRPPIGAPGPLSDRGTRYGWDVAANGARLGMSAVNGRGGSVRTLKRARAAVSGGKRRLTEGRDLYTGR